MRIYVGNLSSDVTTGELRRKFATYGEVESVSLATSEFTNRSRGFAFVEMAAKSESEAAISGLNGKRLRDRAMVVNEDRPRLDSRGGSYGDTRVGVLVDALLRGLV